MPPRSALELGHVEYRSQVLDLAGSDAVLRGNVAPRALGAGHASKHLGGIRFVSW